MLIQLKRSRICNKIDCIHKFLKFSLIGLAGRVVRAASSLYKSTSPLAKGKRTSISLIIKGFPCAYTLTHSAYTP